DTKLLVQAPRYAHCRPAAQMIFCPTEERRNLPDMMRYGVIAAILLSCSPILRGAQDGSKDASTPAPPAQSAPNADKRVRLPTGLFLDTAGTSIDAGNMPLKMIPAPGGRRLVLLMSG